MIELTYPLPDNLDGGVLRDELRTAGLNLDDLYFYADPAYGNLVFQAPDEGLRDQIGTVVENHVGVQPQPANGGGDGNGDLQAALEAANARIAQLEAAVDALIIASLEG